MCEGVLLRNARRRIPGFVGVIVAALATAGVSHAQLLSLPISESGVVLDAANDEVSIDFDAGTLPGRARLVTSIVPDASHPDLEVELEIDCSWLPVSGAECNVDEFGTQFPYSIEQSFAPGPAEFDANLFGCNPFSPFSGETCQVVVRAVDFGAAGAPATVDIDLEAYSKVPTGTLFQEYDPVPQQVSATFPAFRDTTLYERNPLFSNGQGQTIWAGFDAVGGFPFSTFESVHGLLQFNFTGIPNGATVDDATLDLAVLENRGPVSRISVSAVDDRDNSPFTIDTWNSGDVDAPGDEFIGGASFVTGANWLSRSTSNWNTPGAATGSVLDNPLVPTAGGGTVRFQSPAFTAEVARQIQTGDDGLGFQLRNDGLNGFLFADQAVRFGSSENGSPANRPLMTVFYTPEFPDPIDQNSTQTSLLTGTLTFVGEGEDFRWIYDDDGDSVVVTDIGGRCEEAYPGNQPTAPWSYAYTGDPGFQGLDCCTWEIEGVNGVVGAGQAIFFLGIDASAENIPGDLDGDGIRNPCDNCAYTPNGPLIGVCVSPSGGYPDPMAELCRSDLECAAGDYCSLAQEVVGTCDGGANNGLACSSIDDCPGATRCDLDGPPSGARRPGVACPEPGFGLALLVGFGGLVRRRRDRRQHGATVPSLPG